MMTSNEARTLLDTTGLKYKITERGDWYEVETFKDGMVAWRLRSFEPDFEITLQHDCKREAEKYGNK